MEQSSTMCEGEWSSLSAMYATNEESEFMTQLLSEFSPSSVLDGECLGLIGIQSNFFPSQLSANAASKVNNNSFVYSSDPSSSDVCFPSQEKSAYSGCNGVGDMTNFLLSSCQGADYLLEDSNNSFSTDNTIPCFYSSVDFGFEKEETAGSEANVYSDFMMQLNADSIRPKSRAKAEAEYDENLSHDDVYHQGTIFKIPLLDDGIEEKDTSMPVDSKKRTLNAQALKNKRNVKPRRGKKIVEVPDVDEDKSEKYSKDDASAPSDIKNGEFSSLTMDEDFAPSSKNSKTRANRGSATDPQSLYARKRREKINERLRILQGLVPNGTKVDISTMLDEAVQYVKFLQLQIKLLSSDDMWMYAPLAYNGMDLGLDI